MIIHSSIFIDNQESAIEAISNSSSKFNRLNQNWREVSRRVHDFFNTVDPVPRPCYPKADEQSQNSDSLLFTVSPVGGFADETPKGFPKSDDGQLRLG